MALSLETRQARRAVLLTLGATALTLSACQTRAPVRPVSPEQAIPPDLPEDVRHKVALIIPLTGSDGGVGTSISNAAKLALVDTGESRITIQVYDSARIGAAAAAEQALAEGARLILGPLLAEDVRALAPVARGARVPVIAFSNDSSVAGDGVYIMGVTPDSAINSVVGYAREKGASRFGALVPTGLYGQRSGQAMIGAVRANKADMIGMETFNRSAAAARAAAMALNRRGPMDAVLIGDTGDVAKSVAPTMAPGSILLGTELWAGNSGLGQVPRLRGALFAAAPDARFRQLVTRYKARYNKTPYRLGSLGYDAVLLTVRAARGWPVGRPFPERMLRERDGFVGVDGIFRFGRDGVAERALEVRQVTATGTTVVKQAPTSFGD